MPPKTSSAIRTPSASSPSRTTAAPAARGMRRRCILVTSGPATVARMAPTRTGSTMVDVSPRSQTRPTSSSPSPTRNQERRPRSRSHIGAENTRESDDASISTTVRAGASSCAAEPPWRNRSKNPLMASTGPIRLRCPGTEPRRSFPRVSSLLAPWRTRRPTDGYVSASRASTAHLGIVLAAPDGAARGSASVRAITHAARNLERGSA